MAKRQIRKIKLHNRVSCASHSTRYA